MQNQYDQVSASNEMQNNPQQGNVGNASQKTHVRASLAERMEALERRRQKLNQQAAALKKEARKDRNSQLIAWGIFIEIYYKLSGEEEHNAFREDLKKYLKGRELERALAGCDRLDRDYPLKVEEKEKDQKIQPQMQIQKENGVVGSIKNFYHGIINESVIFFV